MAARSIMAGMSPSSCPCLPAYVCADLDVQISLKCPRLGIRLVNRVADQALTSRLSPELQLREGADDVLEAMVEGVCVQLPDMQHLKLQVGNC